MSCHNVGFSVYNTEDLSRALSKMAMRCKHCGEVEMVQCSGARVVADHIYVSSICIKCDRLTGRSVRFYNPKDFP